MTTSSEQSGKEILVPGAGGLATGKAPATVPIDVGPKPAPEKAILKLLLAPAEVTPDERYFILVSGRTAAGERRIGAVSFFPPRPGATETFYLDASAFLADMAAHGATRGELVIALAPVSPDQGLTKSSVRVIDARLVDR